MTLSLLKRDGDAPAPKQKEIHLMRTTIRRLAPLTLAACALMLPATASAKANRKQTKKSAAAAVAYLEGCSRWPTAALKRTG